MKQSNVSIRSAFYLVGAVVLLTFLQACEFKHGSLPECYSLDEAPLASASAAPPTVVFEDPGTIKVMHGSGCAHLDKKKGTYLRIEQSVDVPAYANKAAVFLNGWKVKYSGGDHHLERLATAIGKIKLQPGKLTWNAVGVLGDDKGLFFGSFKAIDWCDWYTVVAWNDTNLHAFVDQGDAESFCKTGGTPSGSDNFFFASNDRTTTALSWFSSFLYNANFASGPTVAILPRGFAFFWPASDHHLYQVAYNLEHSEKFIQSWKYKKAYGELNPLATPPTGRVDSGFVSWGTYSIFKDNATRRDYRFGELVSAMGGPDVGIIQPPFAILPLEGLGGGGHITAGSVGVETKQVVIDNIPYAYAIPMLTGWDLNYDDDDHHVREVGIWLDDLHYAAGTLSYKVSSVLHDDSGNGHFSRHKITILGLRPSGGVPVR